MKFFRKKQSLKDHLTETKYVSVKGFEFILKRVNVTNFLEGTKVLLQTYETHTAARSQPASVDDNVMKKVWAHYADVICASVVMPKITREPSDNPSEIHIDILFNDIDLCNKLYEEIIEFTYGKKNTKKRWFHGSELRTSSL